MTPTETPTESSGRELRGQATSLSMPSDRMIRASAKSTAISSEKNTPEHRGVRYGPSVAIFPLQSRILSGAAVVGVSLAVCLVGFDRPGFAQQVDAETKVACSNSYMQTQTLRAAGKLVEARQSVLRCVQPRCPEVLRRDCLQWHEEISKAIPSVVVGVRNEQGLDLEDARVSVDGVPWADALQGKELTLDPGAHVFRVEHATGSIERRVLVRQGERNRLLTFTLASDASVQLYASSYPDSVASHPESDLTAEHGSSRAMWGYGIGGLGVVALGAGAFFGLKASSKWSERNDHCTDSGCDQVAATASDDAHDAAMVANIGVLTGAMGIGVGSYLLLTDGDDASKETDGTATMAAGVGTFDRGSASFWLKGRW